MPTFMIELRDSDGNDCTVSDVLVSAESKDAALDAFWAWVKKEYPGDEEDGGEGTYHPCDCICPHRKTRVCERCRETWDCSHGGLLIDAENIDEFSTEEDAREAHRRLTYFHTLIDLGEAS